MRHKAHNDAVKFVSKLLIQIMLSGIMHKTRTQIIPPRMQRRGTFLLAIRRNCSVPSPVFVRIFLRSSKICIFIGVPTKFKLFQLSQVFSIWSFQIAQRLLNAGNFLIVKEYSSSTVLNVLVRG